ncbi:MAG: gamma carbonic anhydrase family protein [Firmicutes bacterium]|nr:gamma carbonic anhydrase family protein [Bacillota bacterium]MBQ3112172.1 gamma carbonic anhydrase family protein [Bacillota bacterium]MBQ6842137.1 gamma carbonic anhydrase family protein [Bacillota bacterium]MBR6824320.1 gamma carbonic anhydrase family protein [Bacillota bacterium]MBR7113088.1 gamma carbonic anhydrase family protein [Bacillota bacterium]
MAIRSYKGKTPVIAETAYIAPSAQIIGDVQIGEYCTVLDGAVLRADYGTMTIGNYSNIQENCILHMERDFPCIIGEYCTIGHGAIVHGAQVEDRCLIGMGSVILDGAYIGEGSVVGAAALVPGKSYVFDRSLCVGVPYEVIREVEEERVKKQEAAAIAISEKIPGLKEELKELV